MSDASLYWIPVCKLVHQLHCWCRAGFLEEGARRQTEWGQLLTVPVDGYLEPSGGPIPFRDVEWVEISTKHIKGGMAGLPLQFVDVTAELVAGLAATPVIWQMLETTWSRDRRFADQPVLVARIVNPFGPRASA